MTKAEEIGANNRQQHIYIHIYHVGIDTNAHGLLLRLAPVQQYQLIKILKNPIQEKSNTSDSCCDNETDEIMKKKNRIVNKYI
jgi:hypothetical protein